VHAAAHPDRTRWGSGGETLRAEIDPANMPADIAAPISRLLDETRPPVTDDEAGGSYIAIPKVKQCARKSERHTHC